MSNRLIGRLPKVGIRPVIDGRERGVLESLEEQTMDLAKTAAGLIENNLRFPSGEKVECVISETTIGGVADAAKCADQFEREGVGVSLTVTPAWCYGSEVMDSDPLVPKAIWGFNGSERPGAVYLAAALAGYTQKGLPAFSIFGRDVQDAGDNTVPEDVKEKILRFVKAALAAGQMKGKSYLSLGYTSMGIAGSMVDANFFQDYFGMRTEFVDMTEIHRRVEEGIYDKEEFEKALAWTKINCKEGFDNNPEEIQHSKEQKDREWEMVVKMTLIIRDLMIGNPKLKKAGFGEEAKGRNALIAGFQGQRQWNDSRQSLFSELIIRYGEELNRKEYIQRGLAALYASFEMMYCPENSATKEQWEKVWPFFNEKDYGFMMENYGHGGVTSPDGIGIGEFTIYDWGNGAASETYNRIIDHWGKDYIDVN